MTELKTEIRRKTSATVPHGVTPEIIVSLYPGGTIGLKEIRRAKSTEVYFDVGALYVRGVQNRIAGERLKKGKREIRRTKVTQAFALITGAKRKLKKVVDMNVYVINNGDMTNQKDIFNRTETEAAAIQAASGFKGDNKLSLVDGVWIVRYWAPWGRRGRILHCEFAGLNAKGEFLNQGSRRDTIQHIKREMSKREEIKTTVANYRNMPIQRWENGHPVMRDGHGKLWKFGRHYGVSKCTLIAVE